MNRPSALKRDESTQRYSATGSTVVRSVRPASSCGRTRTYATTAPTTAMPAATRSATSKPRMNASTERSPPASGGHDRAHDGDPHRAADLAGAVQDRRARRRPCPPGRSVVAAAALGVIVSAIPTPPTTSPGSRFQNVASTPSRENSDELRGDQEHPRRHQASRADPVARLPGDRCDEDDQDRHWQERRAGLRRRSSRGCSACRATRRRTRRTSRARRAGRRDSRPCRSRCGTARGGASARADGAR